jgi:putative N6-adenine-specific DNA methylase
MKKKAAEEFAKVKEESIFAFDIQDRVLDFFENRMNAYGLGELIRIEKKDFFDLTAADFPHKGVIVLNPPYGKRIGNRDETRILFQQIFEKLGADFKGWRTGIVVPDQSLADLPGFKCQILPFFHGGLDVFTLTGTI